jgi:hypothetical protein
MEKITQAEDSQSDIMKFGTGLTCNIPRNNQKLIPIFNMTEHPNGRDLRIEGKLIVALH